ncbi:MAG: hypothetical protein AABY84_06525 [Candidatus Firestonebacteria bacterium]
MTIFALAYGEPNYQWVSIQNIIWDDGSTTTRDDLLRMQLDEEKFNNLQRLGLI